MVLSPDDNLDALQVFLRVISVDDPAPDAPQPGKQSNTALLGRLTADLRHSITHARTAAELLAAFRCVLPL